MDILYSTFRAFHLMTDIYFLLYVAVYKIPTKNISF